MSVQRKIDDWFLGFTTHAVRAKQSSLPVSQNRSKGFKAGVGLRNLTAAARKHPEVMVKIPKRLSQNSKGMNGIRNHLDYISRNGEVSVETSTGNILDNKKDVHKLLNQWQEQFGIQNESKYREAINIVLSMPAGTPPNAVKNAAREFAAEQFPNNQYVFALHHESDRAGEPPHPHVHLCVLIQNDMGERLNPRKNDLFEWRVRFAEHLRDEGIQCAATKRPQRGKTHKAENGIVRSIRKRGVLPERVKQWQTELASAIKEQREPVHPFLNQAQKTQSALIQEYSNIAKALYQQGYKTEAKLISKLKKQLEAQNFDTQMQRQYRRINAKARQPETPKPKPTDAFRQPESERSALLQSQNRPSQQNTQVSQPQTQPETKRRRR